MRLFSNFQFFSPTNRWLLKRAVLLVFAGSLLPFSGCGDPAQPTAIGPVGLATDGGSDSLRKCAQMDSNAPAYESVAFQDADGNVPVQELEQDGTLKKAGDLFERAKNTTGETAMGAKDWVQDKIGGAADVTSSAAQKAGDLLKQAKDTTGETAIDAKDWMQEKISGAAGATSDAAGDTLKWATDTFESLKSQGLTTASDTSEWLSQDWKNMESWEYTIASFAQGNDEEKSEKLNALGKHGWECYHVGTVGATEKFYMKKRKESFLRHLPFKDFIKLVPLIQQAKR